MNDPDEDDVADAINSADPDVQYWFAVATGYLRAKERAEVWCVLWFLLFVVAVAVIVLRADQ